MVAKSSQVPDSKCKILSECALAHAHTYACMENSYFFSPKWVILSKLIGNFNEMQKLMHILLKLNNML